MKTFKQIINEHWSEELKDFAKDLTFKEFHKTCGRGDWMLWLFQKSNPDSLRELTLAKGHCANTVRHLMEDERSLAAVDAAIAFGEGRIGREELDIAASAAYAAADPASAAYAAAESADEAARTSNRLQTADICREYLPIEIWNLYREPKELPDLPCDINEKDIVEITQIRLHGKLYNLTEVK